MSDITEDALTAWIRDWLAQELEMAAEAIDPDRSLLEYALSSVSATILVGDLEDHLGVELSPTLVWDFPTVSGLAAHLLSSKAADATATSAASPEAEDDAALLARIDELSDDEVSALLARLEQ